MLKLHLRSEKMGPKKGGKKGKKGGDDDWSDDESTKKLEEKMKNMMTAGDEDDAPKAKGSKVRIRCTMFPP